MQVGAKDVVPAVEMAVRFMQVGESAVVWSHAKFAYGLSSRRAPTTLTTSNSADQDEAYVLPAQAAVAYELTVLQRWEEGDERSPASLVQLALARKIQANDMYVHEWSDGLGKVRIRQAYERIAKDMEALVLSEGNSGDDDKAISDDLRQEAQALRMDALNNIAAVHLRAKEYHTAKEAAVAVLSFEPNNLKALVRAAKAALMDPASEFSEVEAALAAAAQEASHDAAADIAKLQAVYKRRKQAYEQQSKQMYRKAMQKTSGGDDINGTKGKEAALAAGAADSDEPAETTTVKRSPPVVIKKEPINWRRLFWDKILPYGFQLLLPFIMWQIASHFRISEEELREQVQTAAKAGSGKFAVANEL